ncbi:MAG: septal ring lytic transglycosylase RlpA family protein [Candidatus Sericytochromatia bacterium]|nr:septal ring lytic transglycosylase RlpA family protein [Candidatus Sericytochromatia bacterium]
MLFRLLASSAVLGVGLAVASPAARALEIYEPDSPWALAPNGAATAGAVEMQAKVATTGAELLSSNPRFANAVATLAHGRLAADVYVGLRRVMTLPGDDGTRAHAVAEVINRAQARGRLRADDIRPARRAGAYVLVVGGETLITIDERLAAQAGARPSQLVLRWLDNLRLAVGGAPLGYVASRGAGAGTLLGRASWYGPGFHGRRAASGERFDQNRMTAAHKTLPFGTVLLVTNTRNHKSCLVRINDRGPYVAGRMIDLSAAAARALSIDGVGSVRIDILGH